ncbi:tetratricopeptide repeat protein [Aquincola sp. S2]|uniref:protein O-GlcNAc transferase n=1 Tax=Pseudaquabacterium terrae TaxID=2732868 RepID=A0ABX2ENV7_9BURK|nr:tetratricopeptide repeat protein [Aquabacterium terrae]NRF70226.1 tetratricopeptide repeat protein [Aquabacterium terrae]
MPTSTVDHPPAEPLAGLGVTALLDQASALQHSGQNGAAAALYQRWLAANDGPLRHVVLFNLGTLLSTLQRDAEAETTYREALQLQPDFAHALLNLGHVLERRGAHDEALATWQRVIDTQATPELRMHAHNNRGRLFELLRRFPEAEADLVASLTLEPRQFDAIQHYVHLRQKQCKWPAALPFGDVTPHMLMIGTSLLAMMSESDDPALQLLTAQRFVHERCPKPPALPLHKAAPKRSGRIRIGYLSGDLHMHAVGLLMPELLELHDRSKFEVWGFCWTPESQLPQRQRLLAALDQHVRLAGVDDATAAKLIAEAGIDVLVDLQGLTSGARPGILGHRAAPVQVSYLGLPGTSALPGVDWILADRFVIPEHEQRFYSERPIYLPHCYQVSDRRRDVAPTPERATYGLPDDAFVFCSFNNNFKFTLDVFQAWMRILRQVPDSVLWLLADNDTARANMLREADAHGIARERLIFAPRVAPPEYLARFQLADLVLDTFPYNAGTTASDALWMGTPILTLAGRSYISRMAGSLLTAVGLPDLITETLTDYERLAVAIGRTPARAASYKRYLAEHGRQSPLFDLPRLVRDIETEFERLALAQR